MQIVRGKHKYKSINSIPIYTYSAEKMFISKDKYLFYADAFIVFSTRPHLDCLKKLLYHKMCLKDKSVFVTLLNATMCKSIILISTTWRTRMLDKL